MNFKTESKRREKEKKELEAEEMKKPKYISDYIKRK